MGRKLRGFQIDIIGSSFTDTFDNSSIHSYWTTETPGSTTVTEDGTGLTISYAGGGTLTWPGDTPNINLSIDPQDFMAKAYVENFTGQNTAGVGMAHYLSSNKNNCHNIIIEDSGSGDYIETSYNGANVETTGTPSGSAWLVMIRRGYTINLYYSTNALGSEPDLQDMTHIRSFTQAYDYNSNKIALYAESAATAYPALSPRFRKFSLVYSV